MNVVAPPGRICTGTDLVEPVIVPWAGGTVAAFTCRAPDKDGPNEDSIGWLPIGTDRGVLAVADGVGGQSGGASASGIVIRSLERALEPVGTAVGSSIRAAVLDALEHANRAVIDLGVGAATTFAAVEIDRGSLRAYHVGDSEIMVAGQRGRIRLQTISHSPVGYAVESGLIDARDALHHDDRHLVSNIVGIPDMRIEVGSPLSLRVRDTVVLGSDGLFDNLTTAEIVAEVRTGALSDAAARLAERCRRRMVSPAESKPSKPDDLSFLLFRPEPPRAADRRRLAGASGEA